MVKNFSMKNQVVQKDKKDFASLSEIKRFGRRKRTVVVVVLLLVVVAMIPQEYSCLNKFHKFPFGYYTCFNYKESINYNFTIIIIIIIITTTIQLVWYNF